MCAFATKAQCAAKPCISPSVSLPTADVLGLCSEQNEGAGFELKVMNELRNREVEDVIIAVVDGRKGFPGAITAAFPEAPSADLHRALDPT